MPTAFVIHLHTGHGPDHFDLMIQHGSGLATWRLGNDPGALAEGDAIPAVRLPDHRHAYLTYEGPVRGGRGQVRRVDRGQCELLEVSETRWEIRLAGARCRGRFALRRNEHEGEQWTLRRVGERDSA
ncbi:MAG TPA: DNA polymerase ligase N-terminal domain-containing protein [Phycisphaerae bacterium]|nr:DNA polymerase ligase N-terminal domain-containing protein [Phycisphaerae bacterium]